MKKYYLFVLIFLIFLLSGCVFASNDTDNSLDLSVSKENVKMGDSIDFTAVKNSEDTGPVVFKINNKTVTDRKNQSKISVKNKTASLSYSIPDGFKAGKVLVTAVTTINNSRHEANTYFNVEKMNTHFSNVTVYRSGNIYSVTSYILDENNHTVKSQTKVIIKINGKTLTKEDGSTQYYKPINAFVNATFKLDTSFAKRNITLTLVVGDTQSYYGSRHVVENMVDGSTVVKRMNMNFINTSIVRSNNRVKLYSLLVNDNGNLVKDTSKVALKINGVTYKLNNTAKYFYTSNGILDIDFGISQKLVNRDVNFTIVTGDTYSYRGIRKTFSSTLPRDVTISVPKNFAGHYTNISIPVNITCNKLSVDDGKLNIYLNNKIFKTVNVTGDMTSVRLDSVPVGKYTLKLAYQSTYFKSAGASLNLTVTSAKTRNTKVASVFIRLNTPVDENDLSQWLKNGITDVYVQAKALTNNTNNIRKIIGMCENTGIKVHAWIRVFNENGTWIYTKAQQNHIKNFISQVIRINGVEGVVLDYIRYNGANPKKVNATFITNYVKEIYTLVKSFDNKLEVSACLFPEMASTKYYYGQDYAALSNYLDFEMVMAYKYFYNANTAWLQKVTKYVVQRCNKARELTIIQTYTDEEETNFMPVSEVSADACAVMDAGSYGYSLFYIGALRGYPKIF